MPQHDRLSGAVDQVAEYREVESDYQPDGNYQSGDGAGQGGATLPLGAGYRVQEIFFESRIPILSSLSGEVGYRFSDYSGGLEASTDTYKVGLEYSPIDSIRLRGSFQHAVRTPNIYELYSVQQVALNGTIDPCAGATPGLTAAQCANTGLSPALYGLIDANPAAQYNGFIGSNPTLDPEEADTISFGIELQPGFAPGLRVNLDWYSITIDEPIQATNQDLTLLTSALTRDDSTCCRITPDAKGSQWETPGGFIEDTLENLGQIESSGLDLDPSYSIDRGAGGNQAGERSPGRQLHREAAGVSGGVEIERRRQSRVREEPAHQPELTGQLDGFSRNNLQRDSLVTGRIVNLTDDPCRAPAEFPDEGVAGWNQGYEIACGHDVESITGNLAGFV